MRVVIHTTLIFSYEQLLLQAKFSKEFSLHLDIIKTGKYIE